MELHKIGLLDLFQVHMHLNTRILYWFYLLYQRTPLHIAAKEGRFDTLKCLVGKGAQTNIKDKKGVSMILPY